MNLRLCPTDHAVVIRDVQLPSVDRVRLRDLGVREGATVHVVNRSAFGACVLALGADRIGLDSATSGRIDVEVAS